MQICLTTSLRTLICRVLLSIRQMAYLPFQETGHGFSVPAHVQRWAGQGKIHQVRCELEECVQYQLLAQRSGLSYSLCHIRSVDYCKDTAAETFLREGLLKDMMAFKFFGDAKSAICVKRRKAASAAHVLLCVPVDFSGSPSQIYLSIHEPDLHSFSHLGRIMVTHNTERNTWHVPTQRHGHLACTYTSQSGIFSKPKDNSSSQRCPHNSKLRGLQSPGHH